MPDTTLLAVNRGRPGIRATSLDLTGPVALRDLALAMGVSVDSLRQRIHRGTMQARKIGPVWVVDPDEAAAAWRAGRGRSVPRP